ncbi:MAG: MFS transporter [Chloroflexota bacterium]
MTNRYSPDFIRLTIADFLVRSAYQVGKTPLLPIFAASLGATDAFLGLIVSVSTMTGLVLKPLIGILSDRWGRRIWLIVGTIFFTIIPFVYQWVETPTQLFIIRIIHGTATAIYGPVTLAYITEQTKINRAEKLGVFSMARSAGYIVGPALAGWLLLSLDPATIFSIIGFISLIAFIPILFLQEPKQLAETQQTMPLWEQMKDALSASSRTSAVWISGGLESAMFVVLYTIKAFLPLFALEHGVNIGLIGLFFALQEAVHLILKPFGGRLGDTWGYRLTIGSGVIILSGAILLLTFINTGLMLLIPAILMGVAQALIFPSTVALIAAQISEINLGGSMGFAGTLRNFGKVMGPIIGGLMIGQWGFIITIRLLGVCLVLAVFVQIIYLFKRPLQDRITMTPAMKGGK